MSLTREKEGIFVEAMNDISLKFRYSVCEIRIKNERNTKTIEIFAFVSTFNGI